MKTSWFLLFVMSCVFGDTGAVETKSVKKGDSVTLNSDVTKGPNDTMLWYFNNTRIALINGEARKSCVYDGEGGIFRGRLEVDYDTGSLTITNITTDHAGRYEAELFRRDNSGTSVPLNRTSKCNSTSITLKNNNDYTIKTINITVSDPDDTNEESYKVEKKQDSGKNSTTAASIGENEPEKGSEGLVLCFYWHLIIRRPHLSEGSGLSPAAVAGIVVVVLLVAAAAVVVKIYRWCRSRNDGVKEKNKDVLLEDEEIEVV